MQIGEIHKIHIDSYSHDGYGIGRINGFVVMVEGVLYGEECEVIITKILRSYAIALSVKIYAESTQRRTPFCKYFSKCGGCSLQHMSSEEELSLKQGIVDNAISRIGGISVYDLKNILGMDNPYSYRNIVQYHGDGTGNFGFYREGTNQVTDIDECPLQSDLSNKLYKGIRTFSKLNSIDYIKHIIIRISFSEGQAMLILVIQNSYTRHFQKHIKDNLISYITENFPECVSIYLSIKGLKKNHKVIGEENVLIWGMERMLDSIGNLKFYISPQSFFQVNPIQTKVLYDKIAEFTELTGKEYVYDLYCGTGTISLFLASGAKMVTGVESVPEAINDALKNAELNGINNVRFVQDRAENYLFKEAERLSNESEIKCDVVVVDPPRAGCDVKLLESILTIKPERVVYVSCNPATLARDLKMLTNGGYELIKVQPVNMFPGGGHVETVVLLSKLVPQTHINVKVEFGEGEGKIPIQGIAEKVKTKN